MRSILCCLVLSTTLIHAQQKPVQPVYRVKPWPDAAVIGAGAIATYLGFSGQNSKADLTEAYVNGLSSKNVSGFDQSALRIDVGSRKSAASTSDMILFSSVAAPLFLVFDRKVRHEWAPVVTLYFESMVVNSGVQTNVAVLADRTRPMAYLTEVPLEDRLNNVNRSSFFSGHTSSSATACFFLAKVLDDLHPELGNKRWLVYGAAAVPPALAGLYRIRGGKHFPTDVISGYVFGAAMGVLIPTLHKHRSEDGVSFLPFKTKDGIGLTAQWTW